MITKAKLENMSWIANKIIEDMDTDAKELDGKPFTGRTMAELFGAQYAVTQALAKMVKILVDDILRGVEK